MLAKENDCTFAKISRLRSAEKLTEAFAPKYAPPTPPAIIKSAVTIMNAIAQAI